MQHTSGPDNQVNIQLVESWQAQRSAILSLLEDTFRHHAPENRGKLASTRHKGEVARQIYDLANGFIQGELQANSVEELASKLARQGLATSVGARLMQAVVKASWLQDKGDRAATSLADRLVDFQVLFLEALAQARETIQRQIQENAQHALQQALHNQLEEQRRSREQEKRNKTLRAIMELNARLAQVTDEQALLDTAVSGICQTLDLADVTFYEVHRPETHWAIRTTTAPDLRPGHTIPERIERLLDRVERERQVIERQETADHQQSVTFALLLRVGQRNLGAMVANSDSIAANSLYTAEEYQLLLQAFAQNLAALWRNVGLLIETQQRARELEILHGRYVDDAWNNETNSLYASYQQNQLSMTQRPPTNNLDDGRRLSLRIRDHAFGHVTLPDAAALDEEDKQTFVRSIVHEMASALNNAQLIQATQRYSNQLNAAAGVSRAATTILDRNQLISEVVDLIRSRFSLYYVGLFLLDEAGKRAVFEAGTGKAGRKQLEQGHALAVDGSSMIGAAIIQQKAIVEHDVRQAETFTFNPLLPDTQTELALPLRSRGNVIGALSVQSTQTDAFTEETMTVLQSLADQLAVAIENAELFAQTEATLAETSRLYEASRHLNQATDSQSIYQILIDFVRKSAIADIVHIISTDRDNPKNVVAAAARSWEMLSFELPNSYLQQNHRHINRLTQNNEMVIIEDSQRQSPPYDLTHRLVSNYDVACSAIFPIVVEDDWLATMILHRDSHSDPFDEKELKSLQTLTDQAATILANQKLFMEIQAANEQLRQLDQLKTQFLTNMSHELRTPLNSIIGFSRVILKGIDGPITQEQEEDLASIYNSGQLLLMLINEILDMAKIEAGKMTLVFEPVDLAEAAQTALTTVHNLVEEKGLELTYEIEETLPAIEADPVRVRQILINLLSNAAKYTEEGGITLTIEQKDTEFVHIEVSDTGIGIDPKDYSKLFRAFEQVDSSTTRKAAGTGLGLPITKWMVNMHQGKIRFDSEIDKGTTFHVLLPIKQPERDGNTVSL